MRRIILLKYTAIAGKELLKGTILEITRDELGAAVVCANLRNREGEGSFVFPLDLPFSRTDEGTLWEYEKERIAKSIRFLRSNVTNDRLRAFPSAGMMARGFFAKGEERELVHQKEYHGLPLPPGNLCVHTTTNPFSSLCLIPLTLQVDLFEYVYEDDTKEAPAKSLLTEEEWAVVNLLGDAWNQFMKLPTLHSDDCHEFRSGIHQAQSIIMSRPVMREMIAPK
jgi:hypothetical protein